MTPQEPKVLDEYTRILIGRMLSLREALRDVVECADLVSGAKDIKRRAKRALLADAREGNES